MEDFQSITTQSQIISDDAKKLLGARFGEIRNQCDNCKKTLKTVTVVVMKPRYPRQFSTLYILCKNCRLLHSSEVKYYMYLG